MSCRSRAPENAAPCRWQVAAFGREELDPRQNSCSRTPRRPCLKGTKPTSWPGYEYLQYPIFSTPFCGVVWYCVPRTFSGLWIVLSISGGGFLVGCTCSVLQCFGTCLDCQERLPITLDLLATACLGHLPGTLDLLGSTGTLDLLGSTGRDIVVSVSLCPIST